MSQQNIFLDLGLPPVKAAILEFRSELIIALHHIMDHNKWSKSELANMLGTDITTISKVLNEADGIVSIDQLMSWLGMLGVQVLPTLLPIGLYDMQGNPSQDETETPVLENVSIPWDLLVDDDQLEEINSILT